MFVKSLSKIEKKREEFLAEVSIESDKNDRVDKRVQVLEPISDGIIETRHTLTVGLHWPGDNPWQPEDDESARDQQENAESFLVLVVVMSGHSGHR